MSIRRVFRTPLHLLRALPGAGILAAFRRRIFGPRTHAERAAPEVTASVRTLLAGHRAQMDAWFFLVRMALGLGLVGYLMVDAMLSARGVSADLLFMIGYLGLNLCVVSIGGHRLRQARWLYAALDLTFFLLLRHLFLFEALVDPNATMVGFFTLLLIAYASYSDPQLVAAMALAMIGATSLTLGLDTLHLAPPRLETLAYRLHPLRAFLLLSYLGALCLITYALALRLRRQMLAYSTELHKRTQEAMGTALERARCDKLEELNRLKRGFIARLSHDLRTPLTPLRTALEMMQSERALDDGTAEKLHIALNAADRLQRLVQDYAYLSELLAQEEGRPHRCNVRLADLLETVTAHLRSGRFTFHILPDLAVSGDPRLLGGTLLALMRRADLLTPSEASVDVEGHLKDGQIVVAVHDPARHGEKATLPLNDPLLPSSRRTPISSSADLELILAQYSLRRLGGSLHVACQEAIGTTVYCTLPGARKGAPWFSSAQLRLELASLEMLRAC